MKSKKEKKEYTISIKKANFYSMVYILPILLILGGPYLIKWGISGLKENIIKIGNPSINFILFFISIIFGIIIHELIHGFFWALKAEKGWKSIKFGIKWKVLTPYTHCKIPLETKYYSLGVIMPAIVLGIIPAIIAIINGKIFLLAFGILFTIAAGGDFVALIMLSRLDSDYLVQDHPSKMGFMIYNSQSNHKE
ncbi:MAG: DUF3267 domain-containing protein [Candidatus Marinimicrobia bacterium]|nr:DUF3267 domain-containing protein [Candidatus Neomarinimicrobiota bacterium]